MLTNRIIMHKQKYARVCVCVFMHDIIFYIHYNEINVEITNNEDRRKQPQKFRLEYVHFIK